MDKVYRVGIIGGGVSGVVTSLQLADLDIDNILFEKEESVVNGPPFCHLHASRGHCSSLSQCAPEPATARGGDPTLLTLAKSM